jgi:hypothetical protein
VRLPEKAGLVGVIVNHQLSYAKQAHLVLKFRNSYEEASSLYDFLSSINHRLLIEEEEEEKILLNFRDRTP